MSMENDPMIKRAIFSYQQYVLLLNSSVFHDWTLKCSKADTANNAIRL